uniref:putative F-box protein At3g10240 n=1 Tax=Erigeron canadensis TaxID=72917 RepID=UPI001CB8F59D|nr:putative F-box protein At3g10240 [Erigeron canadensis]
METRMMKKKKFEKESRRRRGSPNNIPKEIIEEILSRLPAITLARLKTACKQWLSLISHPSFAQLRHSRNPATTSGFFVHAHNKQTDQHYILKTTSPNRGPLIHLLTINKVKNTWTGYTRTEHINGLVLVTSNVFAYVVNPTTRQVFNLPFPQPATAAPNNVNVETQIICRRYNFFGFDQSQNQHKILHMRLLRSAASDVITAEFEVFSLSDYSWRKLDNPTTLPADPINIVLVAPGLKNSVCVNSVIHMMLPHELKKILTFDLITECFSVIDLLVDLPPKPYTRYHSVQGHILRDTIPLLTQINNDGGLLLGLVCHDRLVETNDMDIWILQDHENRGVWAKKTITLSADKLIGEEGPLPWDYCDKYNKIVFSCQRMLSKKKRVSKKKMKKDVIIGVPVYDLKHERFKSLNFVIGDDHPFLHPKNVFIEFKSYIETIYPLNHNI